MLKLNRLNRKGVEAECIITVEDIVGLFEKKVEPTTLYDEDGNVAQTVENPSTYEVHFTNGRDIHVTKETYDKLVKKLSVETL
ncbi:MAG: hypothetical protein K5765_07000 [Clostridia bacterium]|nr:hypothetical protein [Clostridia bacterium]